VESFFRDNLIVTIKKSLLNSRKQETLTICISSRKSTISKVLLDTRIFVESRDLILIQLSCSIQILISMELAMPSRLYMVVCFLTMSRSLGLLTKN